MKRHPNSVVTFLYAALTVIAVWPLSVRPGRFFFGGAVDKYLYTWDLRWFQEALLKLHQNPFITDRVFYPAEHSLVFHSLMPLASFLMIPVSATLGPVTSYNMLLVASFFLTALFTYYLAYDLAGQRVPAVFAGVVAGFHPVRWITAAAGQLTYMPTFWIPLFLIFLNRSLKKGDRTSKIACGVTLAGAVYTDYYISTFAIVLGAMVWLSYALWPLSPSRMLAALRSVIVPGLVFVLLIIPVLFMAWQAFPVSHIGRYDDSIVERYSSNPEHLLGNYPFKRLSVVGNWINSDEPGESGMPFGGSGPFTGFVLLGVFLFGLFRSGRKAGMIVWAALSIVFVSLSFGISGWSSGNWPSLYSVSAHLPLLNTIRAPNRYLLAAAICLAVAGAFALARRPVATDGQKNRKGYLVLATVFTGLVFLEYLWLPLKAPAKAMYIPSYYSELPIIKERPGLLELPYWASGAAFNLGFDHRPALLYQSVHGRPLLNGHISRIRKETLNEFLKNRVFLELSKNEVSEHAFITMKTLREELDRHRVGTIVLRKKPYRRGEVERLATILEVTARLESPDDLGDAFLFQVHDLPDDGLRHDMKGNSVSLLKALPLAEIEGNGPVRFNLDHWTIGSESHPVLFQRTRSEVSYLVSATGESELIFYGSMDPDYFIQPGDGFDFVVTFSQADRAEDIVVRRFQSPPANKNAGRWTSHRVAFPSAGEWQITLSLGPGPEGDERRDAGGWGDPRIVAKAGTVEVKAMGYIP